MNGSEYVNEERRVYSLYVLQRRAIPHAADGLKAAARRVLWTARDGKKYKSATLAGATMPIHPHDAPAGTINTLAAPFKNNIPLLKGTGAFGTLLDPGAYGASRYTEVLVSQFTKDVVFKDIEIVPMIENYDGTLEEPKHFLPLIPTVLLNPQEGIAVGFKCDILPRDLTTIIESQIAHLEGREFDEIGPALVPINQYAQDYAETISGNAKWIFRGEFTKENATTVHITNLPYGVLHEKFMEHIEQLKSDGKIMEYEDNSEDEYDIKVRFKKGFLRGKTDEEIMSHLGLESSESEIMNVISFDGESVWTTNFVELIKDFCDWRLKWYYDRYKRLADLLAVDIQKYKDILLAIKKNVGGLAPKMRSRSELKEFLQEIGIIHIDFIADLSIYRFTEEERKKTEEKLDEAEKIMTGYLALLKSEAKRRILYTEELKWVLKQYKANKYQTSV